LTPRSDAGATPPAARCALALAAACALHPLPEALAAETVAARDGGEAVLPTIVVSGSRSERVADEVPATVTARDADELETRQARDIRDLERYEPNVSVRRAPSRFTAAGASTGRPGNEGFNIRGLEGNRVLIQVDGVRVPNGFSFGANAFGRGDWLDLSTIKRVEILRGPAATLYGSDGLAGVVSFFTLDPADLLARTGRDTALTAGLGYAGEDSSLTGTLGGAARIGQWEAMAIYTRRQGNELRNQGTIDTPDARRTTPNPQDISSDALLAKLVWRTTPDSTLRFTVDALRRNVDTNALSAVAVPPLTPTSTVGLTAADTLDRTSFIVDQRIARLGWTLADGLRWNLYHQRTDARQLAIEDRSTASDRVRDTRYEERWTGGGIVLDKRATLGGLDHRWVFGGDIGSATYSGLRDGVVPPPGERFPSRAFPDTRYTLAGLFVQDEIALAGDRLKLIPALRWDAYRLDATGDALFTAPVVDASASRLSPRLGAILRLDTTHSLFANLSTGFRAPTADQVNNGFANPVANYRSIGNPDLKPETSRSVEIGARRSAPSASWSVSAFAGEYEDFIDQRQVSGSFRPADPAVFQYVNVGAVRLYGIEGTGWWRFAPGWRAMGGAGWVRGDNRSAGVPLNTVDPWRVFAGVDWTPVPRATFGIRATHVGAKPEDRIDSASLVTPPAQQYAPPSFTTIDLFASWQVNRALRLSAGLFNLTDRTYWRWADVRGLSSSSPVIDAFSQPGRSFSITARIDL
jgi:hemoglobin/transferrin/lactoferrin receptor protein